jgi:hypothetical protein
VESSALKVAPDVSSVGAVGAHRLEHTHRPPLTRRIKIVLVLVLEKWGWGGGVLEYRAVPELHPRSGLKVLVRRFFLVLVVALVLESGHAE